MSTTLAEDYLVGRGGSVSEYHYNVNVGQRLGQAFFNALSGHDQERIRGTKFDTFHTTANRAIVDAIEFLLYGDQTHIVRGED